MRGTARIYASVVAPVVIGLLTAACSSGPAQTPAQASASAASASAAAAASASAAARAHAALLASELKITPANGSRSVDPSAGITVTATKGKVTNVTVTTSGDPVTGTLSGGGKKWHSAWTLNASQTYTVTATGTDASGQKITTTSRFRTL
ncbi:MAG TPA: Ig-like domain-containing protein, partial [Streptosporangiaceae bacterium]|nr:Ig-like domain-containing protein [Streptosporangiaceae bacterium]